MRSAHIALATTLSLLSGCSSDSQDSAGGPSAPAASPPWFVEVAEERGLTWVHSKGEEVRYWFPEVMGPGAGVLDYDRDGDMDLYLVQSGDLSKPEGENAGDRLFANDGAGNFADVTEATGATDRGYGMGCACGDYDGDEFLLMRAAHKILLPGSCTSRPADNAKAHINIQRIDQFQCLIANSLKTLLLAFPQQATAGIIQVAGSPKH